MPQGICHGAADACYTPSHPYPRPPQLLPPPLLLLSTYPTPQLLPSPSLHLYTSPPTTIHPSTSSCPPPTLLIPTLQTLQSAAPFLPPLCASQVAFSFSALLPGESIESPGQTDSLLSVPVARRSNCIESHLAAAASGYSLLNHSQGMLDVSFRWHTGSGTGWSMLSSNNLQRF